MRNFGRNARDFGCVAGEPGARSGFDRQFVKLLLSARGALSYESQYGAQGDGGDLFPGEREIRERLGPSPDSTETSLA